MEGYYKKMVIIIAVILGLAIGSEAIFGNGQSSGLCRMTKEGLHACQPSVSGVNPVPPSALCCSALSNADMQCFCLFKNSRLLNLYGIDPNLAMDLPAKCNLDQTVHC